MIDAKLAACVLISDVKSFYNWEGKLNEDDEVVTLLKTSTEKVAELEKYIATNHDYDVSCHHIIPSQRQPSLQQLAKAHAGK